MIYRSGENTCAIRQHNNHPGTHLRGNLIVSSFVIFLTESFHRWSTHYTVSIICKYVTFVWLDSGAIRGRRAVEPARRYTVAPPHLWQLLNFLTGWSLCLRREHASMDNLHRWHNELLMWKLWLCFCERSLLFLRYLDYLRKCILILRLIVGAERMTKYITLFSLQENNTVLCFLYSRVG